MHEQSIGEKIVAKAESHLGEHEIPDGSNRGPFIDRVLLYNGVDPVHSTVAEREWCADFACFCVGNVLAESGLPNALHPRTPSSGGIVEWGRKHGRIISEDQVEPGDLAIVKDPNSPTGYRHTTIIREVMAEGRVGTIEGNEGNAVREEERDMDSLAFVRPWVV